MCTLRVVTWISTSVDKDRILHSIHMELLLVKVRRDKMNLCRSQSVESDSCNLTPDTLWFISAHFTRTSWWLCNRLAIYQFYVQSTNHIFIRTIVIEDRPFFLIETPSDIKITMDPRSTSDRIHFSKYDFYKKRYWENWDKSWIFEIPESRTTIWRRKNQSSLHIPKSFAFDLMIRLIHDGSEKRYKKMIIWRWHDITTVWVIWSHLMQSQRIIFEIMISWNL